MEPHGKAAPLDLLTNNPRSKSSDLAGFDKAFLGINRLLWVYRRWQIIKSDDTRMRGLGKVLIAIFQSSLEASSPMAYVYFRNRLIYLECLQPSIQSFRTHLYLPDLFLHSQPHHYQTGSRLRFKEAFTRSSPCGRLP